MEYLQELNPQQKKAVLEEHKLICVIAGPGCGKTKTLISRIIHLLTTKKIEPRQILVLTFAKKAIKEIKKRIYPYTSPAQKSELNIYNFHSFCYSLLSKHASLLGFPENKFPVYDRHDQENIIKKIVYDLNYNAEKKEIGTILSLIGRWKNSFGVDPLNLTEVDRPRYQIYQEYQKYLQENQALDFNDLLIYTIKLFRLHPEIKSEYQKQFVHILIDEFQDVNDIHNLLVPTKTEGAKIIQFSHFPLKLIIRRIRWLLTREKCQFNDIAFLYRNNYLSMRIEQELIAQKIPYEILGAFKFIERGEIKDVLAFLRTILYQDNLSLLRVLNLMDGIGARTIEKIEINSQKQGEGIYHYLNNYQNIVSLSLAGNEENATTEQLKLSPKQTAKIYKKLIKTRNNLILSSIHQAKGLEFEIVFFVYLDEGTLPYKENKDLLLCTTKEGYRVYPYAGIINNQLINEIHIDPHYEEEHGSYMTDEVIYNFALRLRLNDGDFEPEEKEARDKEILDKLTDPNYQGGSWGLPENPIPLEKIKYKICQRIIRCKRENKLTAKDIAEQIEISTAETQDILHYRLNKFTLDSLVIYLEKLTPY
ncbi:1145_t:CDS:2 [Entrophospora sp. SA101]|nr:8799_t:CDS:2 [Entrophospora sp. SA101]CAJ0837484.1 1145_t:CDS:2 [Entrophospora sp. SA101]